MNYVIFGPPRSGTSYLGEFIKLQGLPYFNELFTPEICRTEKLWPAELERIHLKQRVDLAFSIPGAGFKLPYDGRQQVFSYLNQLQFVKVIHLTRDDLLEEFASWTFLNRAGVSLAREDGSLWNTDGTLNYDLKETPPYMIDPLEMAAHFDKMQFFRDFIHWAFHDSHEYLTLSMEEVFHDGGRRSVCEFLGTQYIANMLPDHVKTPRPKAREMFSNWGELKAWFEGTQWQPLFEQQEAGQWT